MSISRPPSLFCRQQLFGLRPLIRLESQLCRLPPPTYPIGGVRFIWLATKDIHYLFPTSFCTPVRFGLNHPTEVIRKIVRRPLRLRPSFCTLSSYPLTYECGLVALWWRWQLTTLSHTSFVFVTLFRVSRYRNQTKLCNLPILLTFSVRRSMVPIPSLGSS